jgi:UDP-N-acetylmuramoyl-L-alanyl-D-glutamate--2,6-diaminopimelate ligase
LTGQVRATDLHVEINRETWEALGWYTENPLKSVKLSELSIDSRNLKKHWGFLAYDGITRKGTDFIPDAFAKKAAAVFIDKKYKKYIDSCGFPPGDCIIFYSENFLQSAADLISEFYGNPSHKMSVVGITGTNGKTSIAWMLYEIFNQLAMPGVYIGTLGNKVQKHYHETGLTTPDGVTIQKFLQYALKKKAKYAVLEASSHGLFQGRLAGIHWNIAIFTNLTPEHLDFHKTMEDYFNAKKILFENLIGLSKKDAASVQGVIICTDNPWGEKLYRYVKNESPGFPVLSVNESDGDVKITAIQARSTGYRCKVLYRGQSYILKTKLLGVFNIYNIVCVFITLLLLKFSENQVIEAIEDVKPPPGRMEKIYSGNNRTVYIDYAHTGDALEQSLKAIQHVNPVRILLVFGCGGERDKDKRSIMGNIATVNADFVFITNDNPRNEDPQLIFNDIKSGINNTNYVIIPEREKAIQAALQIMKPHEVLLIAGKGHEEYQQIKGQKIKFSDKEAALKLIKKMDWKS